MNVEWKDSPTSEGIYWLARQKVDYFPIFKKPPDKSNQKEFEKFVRAFDTRIGYTKTVGEMVDLLLVHYDGKDHIYAVAGDYVVDDNIKIKEIDNYRFLGPIEIAVPDAPLPWLQAGKKEHFFKAESKKSIR